MDLLNHHTGPHRTASHRTASPIEPHLKDPEQDSPAMSLLCSITKASAKAVPEIRSPRFQARLRQRDHQRPRFASINSSTGSSGGGGGNGGGTEGEFYRLPWYRRPLPSNRRTSVAGGEGQASLKRSREKDKSMLVVPRTGSMTNMMLRQPRGSTGGAAAFAPLSAPAPAAAAPSPPVAAAPAPAAGAPGGGGGGGGFGAEGGGSASRQRRREQQEKKKEQAPVPVHGGGAGAGEGVVQTTEPPTMRPVTVRPPPSLPSLVPQVAAKDGFPPVMMPSPAAAEVVSTPTANSMAADRDASIAGESRSHLHPGNPNKVVGAAAAAGAADAGANADGRADGDGDADRDAGLGEIKRLRAEVNRLNRELASLAAAAVKETNANAPATERAHKGEAHPYRPSPRIEVTSPVLSSAQTQHSKWEWDPKSLGSDESSEAGRVARPMSARLRADNSWMRRSSSDVGDGGGGHHKRRSSGNNWGGGGGRSTGNGSGFGFGDRARAGSVLPDPSSGGSRGRDRSPSGDGDGDGDGGGSGGQGHATEERLLLSPPASGLNVEGPSPASGEKGEEAKAAVGNGRRRKSSVADSIEEEEEEVEGKGGNGGESARSSSSVRQMSVFFPVQEPQSSSAQASAASKSAVTAEGAAALARAAATQIGATASPPEAARAAQAARDAFSLRQQQQQQQAAAAAAAARDAAAAAAGAAAPVVYAKIPTKAAGAGAVAGADYRRRGGSGESNGRVWRWVLAQRVGNQTVRQALISHGLPPLARRHIWAAWADVATPET